MPGILGVISKRPADECQGLVRSMIQSMEHEDFYRSGTYAAADLGVYGGWVALERSFAAGQVFFNETKDVALLVSGEIFAKPAKKEPQRDSKKNACSWLFNLYEQYGEQFFAHLNGLFSGLLIDKRKKRAFLFNDRYGFDRVYVHEDKDATYFASEAKALLRLLPQTRDFDPDGVAQFLAVGCTLGERTLFKGVELLPAASVWRIEGGQCVKSRYFSPAAWESQPTLSAEDFQSQLHETFVRILPRYCESPERIGISLTAGLDSRMLMAGLTAGEEKPVCYTFGGARGATLDARLAAQVAKSCGFEHSILRIGPDFFANFATLADRTVFLTDGYFGIWGAHEIYLNRQARALAPIRLTGVFGGEILREVSTFKACRLSAGLLVPELARAVESSARAFHSSREHPVTFAAFKEIPWNIFGSLAACRSQVSFRTPYMDNDLVGLAYQAPASVRQSSNSAVQLVSEMSAPLARIRTDMGFLGPHGQVRKGFARLISKVTFKLDYLCNDGMADWLSPLDPVFDRLNSNIGLVGLHKYLRYRRWFRRELKNYVSDALGESSVLQSPFWNAHFIRKLAQQHIDGRKNYLPEINTVLTLGAVRRLLLREPPQPLAN